MVLGSVRRRRPAGAGAPRLSSARQYTAWGRRDSEPPGSSSRGGALIGAPHPGLVRSGFWERAPGHGVRPGANFIEACLEGLVHACMRGAWQEPGGLGGSLGACAEGNKPQDTREKKGGTRRKGRAMKRTEHA